MIEPKQIIAGFPYSWTKKLPLYKASAGWTLAYSITSPNAQYDVTAVGNGDDFDVAILKTESEKFEAGLFTLIGFVDDGTDGPIRVFSNDLVIVPDPRKPGDFRSYAQKALEAIKATLLKSATKDQQSLTVDGQSLQRRTMAELLTLRDRWEREVRKEKRLADLAAGIGKPGRVQTRFK
jgi:hypothetical protein